jgi:hypothetical protein
VCCRIKASSSARKHGPRPRRNTQPSRRAVSQTTASPLCERGRRLKHASQLARAIASCSTYNLSALCAPPSTALKAHSQLIALTLHNGMRSFVEIKSNKRSLTVLVTGRYFVALLEAYGVDSVHTSLRWAEHIDGVGLDWPLGAVIRETCAAAADVDLEKCRGVP